MMQRERRPPKMTAALFQEFVLRLVVLSKEWVEVIRIQGGLYMQPFSNEKEQ